MINNNIIKGLHKREFHTGGVKPVYSGYYDHIDKITGNPKPWKTLEDFQASPARYGRFFTSLKLTYMFRALELLKTRETDESATIYAATINIKEQRIKALSSISRTSHHTVAYNYSTHLKKRLKRRDIEAEFIAVVELGARNKLHIHIAILCKEKDRDHIRKCLAQDTDHTNAVLLKSTFKRDFRPRDQIDIELEELNREFGLSNFPLSRGVPPDVVYYSKHPIDAGWVDYLSKELRQRSALNGRKFYCSRAVNQLAKSEYDAKRRQYLKLMK